MQAAVPIDPADAAAEAAVKNGPARHPLANEEEGQQEEEEDEDSEEDEEESEDDDPAQTIQDIGRHERMQRIQKVLYEQLVGNDERVSLELREKEEELRRVKQQREDVGVALYGVQQQLAQLQMALEASHRKLNGVHDGRFQAEDQLDEWKESLGQKKLQVEKHRAHVYKTQGELDALNVTLRQVETYNEEMRAEIARTQRAAHKAEETMTTMEKDKVKQDLYIDSLNEQIKALHDKVATHMAQLKAQQQETAAADETLREASQQMEAVAFEKKQLLQQWKSSVVGLQQRDQALQATQTAISKVGEDELSVASELRGYKQSIDRAQRIHETLTATIDRVTNEIRFVEEQLAARQQEHERLRERYELLTKSLQQTEAQAAKVATETKRLELETTQVQQHVETTQRERHSLEDAIATQKNTQTTVHKAAHNLTKAAMAVQTDIHGKEIALANLENEMARVGVDLLTVAAHASQLRERHAQLVGELKRDDVEVEKAELEIRQRNDEIEKKMLRLDRLNKKYEQLVAKLEDENTGPLEATIHHLTKETARVRQQNLDKQRQWLEAQTALVSVAAASQTIGEKTAELTSKTSVLEQKQLRLQRDLDARKKDLQELRAAIQGMHVDTVKLNELLSTHSRRHEALLHTNHAMELEFKRELQELEADATQLEQQAAQLKRDKQDLLDRILEVERQIMLWEKKIQLEKETQAALDPEVGQAEARAMEKEIHRMRLRLEALQRSQEQLLQDMEQAIRKRDLIALRGRSKKETELTYASLTTKVSTLQNHVRQKDRDTAQLEKQLQRQHVAAEDVAFQLEKARAALALDEQRGAALQQQLNAALYDKQRYIDAEHRKRRLLARLDKRASDVDAEEEAARARHAVEAVRAIIAALQAQSPHLNEVLARVALLADDPPV